MSLSPFSLEQVSVLLNCIHPAPIRAPRVHGECLRMVLAAKLLEVNVPSLSILKMGREVYSSSLLLLLFFFFRAAPMAYGGSQVQG